MTSGDTTSSSTKAIRKYNEDLLGHAPKNGIFGRKIDGIICYYDLELCLCECKPASISSSILLKEQIKNLRSNNCVFHHLNSLSPGSDDDLHIYGMDWCGNYGTMYIMMNIDNAMVAAKVGNLIDPDDPMELDTLKKSVSLLLCLKNHLLKLTRKYGSLHQSRKRRIDALDDEDDDDDESGFRTPPATHQISPNITLGLFYSVERSMIYYYV